MADRPILFSAPMVRALLDGSKTQTRRAIKPRPWNAAGDCVNIDAAPTASYSKGADGTFYYRFDHPRGGPLTAYRALFGIGDRLWVKETWAVASIFTDFIEVRYRAHERASHTEFVGQIPVSKATGAKITWPKWLPSIFMRRWASRITLAVTDVRVERLQDISATDAIAEGLLRFPAVGKTTHWASGADGDDVWFTDPREAYADLWRRINGPAAWDANPWVVAVSFSVAKGNIDA